MGKPVCGWTRNAVSQPNTPKQCVHCWASGHAYSQRSITLAQPIMSDTEDDKLTKEEREAKDKADKLREEEEQGSMSSQYIIQPYSMTLIRSPD